jgi:hypothetical protein
MSLDHQVHEVDGPGHVVAWLLLLSNVQLKWLLNG